MGSALAALTGCPNEQVAPVTTPPVGTPPVVAVPSHAGPLPSASATGQVNPREGDRPKIPPLDMPKGISGQAEDAYSRLARQVPQVHAGLDAAWKLLSSSSCSIDKDECQAHWRAIAKHIEQAHDARNTMAPRCSGSSAIARMFDARLQAHEEVIVQRFTKIEQAIAKQLSNEAQRQKWKDHRSAVATPQPCLKYACEDW